MPRIAFSPSTVRLEPDAAPAAVEAEMLTVSPQQHAVLRDLMGGPDGWLGAEHLSALLRLALAEHPVRGVVRIVTAINAANGVYVRTLVDG
ncbi:MAG: hypothetical protein ACOYLX_17810 [Burkholderiaceae bacterium]